MPADRPASLTFNVRRAGDAFIARVRSFGRAYVHYSGLVGGMRVPKHDAFRMRIRTRRGKEQATHATTYCRAVRADGTNGAFMACYLPPRLQNRSVVVETSLGVGRPWHRA